MTTPSYANVLHRLALGEEITGAELLALPGLGATEYVEPSKRYSFAVVPELLTMAFDLAITTDAPPTTELTRLQGLQVVAELMDTPPDAYPLPELARAMLWQIGMAADLAAQTERN